MVDLTCDGDGLLSALGSCACSRQGATPEMGLFRRREKQRTGTVALADVSTEENDYPVFTVGQSRLTESFASLGFSDGDAPRFALATLVPVIDPAMRSVADIEIRLDGHIVGYLRPPALTTAIALLDENRAASLTAPVMLLSTPAGPEVRVHSTLM